MAIPATAGSATVGTVQGRVARSGGNPQSTQRLVRHFPALDGLRGWAVLSVFAYHYGGGRSSQHLLVRAIGEVCSVGWTGVTLFFLLSGFLITGLLWDAKGQAHWMRNFYVRRALRILPLYYGTLLAMLVWCCFDPKITVQDGLKAVGIHALYLQNVPYFNQVWKQIDTPFWLEHYWTLAVEEQFYLLWPLLLLLVRTRRQAFLLCLACFGGSLGFNLWDQFRGVYPPALMNSLLAHAGELAFGGAISFAFRSGAWRQFKRSLQAAGLGCAVLLLLGRHLFGGSPYAFQLTNTVGLTAVTLVCGAVLASMLEAGPWQRVGSARGLRWLGSISFGAYIFHLLPVHGFNYLTMALGQGDGTQGFYLLRFFLAGGVTIVMAVLSFRYYERPFLKYKDRFAAHPGRKGTRLPEDRVAVDNNLSALTETSAV